MKTLTKQTLNAAIATAMFSGGLMHTSAANAETDALTQAIVGGKAYADFRLRFEDAESGSLDTNAFYLRSRIGYKTGSFEGFSAQVEFEDNRAVLGMEEDLDQTINSQRDLILDGEFTELDQGFIQYKNDMVTAKLGRQVIALDGQRHVGHVGWRQDRQTFDAGRVTYKPIEGLTLDYAHVYRVNRINSPFFGDVRTASHDLFNVSYKSPVGKIAAYYYDLSEEVGGPGFDATTTAGLSLNGKTGEDIKFLYALEYAQQDNDTKDKDMDYIFAELGLSVSGVTGKLGYEVLGSDDGTENFSTPLATVHKFAGWADVFAAPSLFGTINGGDGLVDTYASVSTKIAGVKLAAVYHDFEGDDSGDDLGDEIDLLAATKFGKHYNAGLKYADYSAPAGADDKKVMWAWVGMSF